MCDFICKDTLHPGVLFSPMGREVINDVAMKIDPKLEPSVPQPAHHYTPKQMAQSACVGTITGMQQLHGLCKSKIRGTKKKVPCNESR